MISDRLAGRLAARNIHYGWVVAGATFLTMLATAAAMGSAGVLIDPLQREFGWSNAEISSALALRLVLYGLFGPFAAALMNHFGIRKVVSVALLLIIGGIACSFAMTKIWQMVLLWGVVVGIGTGITALVLGATVAARWFTKRRGLVVGLMTASNATGQLVFLPMVADLTERYGWRWGLCLVIAVLFVAMLCVLALMRDHPADLGLPRYGDAAVTPAQKQQRSLVELIASPIGVLREAARAPVFWALFFTFYVCGFSTNGLVQTHWISICGDYGVAAVGAAGILAVIGAFDLVGTIGSGWLSDRYDNRWLLFWFYGLRGLSLLYLPFTGFDIYALSLFAVFYGLDWVATVPPTVKLSAERFGPERAGLVFGWVFAGHQLGAASAAFFAGAIRTELDSYMPAIFVAGTLCLMAAGLIISLRRHDPARPALQAA
ncbi:MAG TPA: MFS transporter [Pararhizobium sp.]|nr:MFS transporter [Pararhizobium sp.]